MFTYFLRSIITLFIILAQHLIAVLQLLLISKRIPNGMLDLHLCIGKWRKKNKRKHSTNSNGFQFVLFIRLLVPCTPSNVDGSLPLLLDFDYIRIVDHENNDFQFRTNSTHSIIDIHGDAAIINQLALKLL